MLILYLNQVTEQLTEDLRDFFTIPTILFLILIDIVVCFLDNLFGADDE